MKHLKNFALIFTLLLFSCNNFINNNSNSQGKDSLHNEEEVETIIVENIFFETFKLLPEITSSDTKLQAKLKKYASIVLGDIKTEEAITNAFELRIELQDELSLALEDYFFDNENSYEIWEDVETELNILGFQSVYAEGMFIGLAIFPILQKEIKTYGTEEFQLYIKIIESNANTFGGEYPYMSLDAQAEVLKLGEIMLKKYKKSSYYAKVQPLIFDALYTYTDYHEVIGDEYKQFCISGFSIEYWPTATDIAFHDNFIKNNSNSMFHNIISKIRENVSEIDPDEPYIYVIVTDKVKDYEEGQKIIWKYLLQDIDIPHNLILYLDNKTQNYVAYRFYTDIETVKIEIEKIKKIKPDAEIIKTDISGKIIE